MKHILAICGSTRKESVNLSILRDISHRYKDDFTWSIFTGLDQLPHFNPDIDNDTLPESVRDFRELIEKADGVMICTPEYVYSLPGSFKNAIEWTVSTVLFTDKPTALITASSSGVKAFEALHSLMKTLGARISPDCSLLINAPKNKVSAEGVITDTLTIDEIDKLMKAFASMLDQVPSVTV